MHILWLRIQHLCILFQVLLKSSDYATFALYAMSCLVLMVLALLLPIETKGRSMKVRNHQLSIWGEQSCEEQTKLM